MTWLLIILGLWIWWMSGYSQRKRLRQLIKELPTTIPAMPLIGQAYLFIGNGEDMMKAYQRLGRDAVQQGGTIAYWQGQDLLVGVADPVVADLLLKNCLTKYETLIRLPRDFTGNGSITAPVHIWRPRRKILTPIFSPKNINAFVKVFAKQSATLLELLQPKVGAGDFSIFKYMTAYALDSVSETNFGVKTNSQKTENHPFLVAFEKVGYYLGERLSQPWLYSDFIYRMTPSYRQLKSRVDYMDNFMNEILKEKRKTRNGFTEKKNSDATEPRIRSVLELLMETSGKDRKLKDVELVEEMKVIISAGTDTSAVGACYTLLMLARHPEIQEKVYKELHEVLGDSDREVTAEDLPHLKYLEITIKEALRLYPPVPAILRETSNDVTLPNGVTLPKGVGIIMFIEGMHRNYRYWGDDVDSFRPERFLEPLKHPAQFIPFSWGMRNCLGYQYAMVSMKTVLAATLRRYQVLPPSYLDPSRYKDPIRSNYSIMMKDVDNFIVRLKERA